MDNSESCNSLESPLRKTSSETPYYKRITEELMDIIYTGIGRLILGYYKLIKHKANIQVREENLNLNPGDLVEVLSIREISLTLNARGRNKGLYFIPEMRKYCGQKFKVFKKVETIKLESSGELRRFKSPTVFLEGVYCNGDQDGGCDRSCFYYWREVWLKRTY